MKTDNNVFENKLEFSGVWRTYQKRVLYLSAEYNEDNKIHIVAPPGSGKTTLGIELIRRLGKPCLILSPTLVIRQQWLERVKEAFLIDVDGEEQLLSNDIRKPALLTSITYQTLFSGMTQYRGLEKEETTEMEEEKGKEKEEDSEADYVDYGGFELIQAVKNAGIGTICLDECHHLRSEWWKALEQFVKQMDDITVVSLTATPPYDSTPAQWQRYIELCGQIDEEIIVPELVQDKSLCPHQDYVYFNFPTAKEMAQTQRFREDTEELFKRIMSDEVFAELVASHNGIADPENGADVMLDNPPYLVSILCFLDTKKLPYPKKWLRILGVRHLPKFDLFKMELLMQGVLFDDAKSYIENEDYLQALIKELKQKKCIERRKVKFVMNKSIENTLVNSAGKLDSIKEIVKAEYGSMKKELRLLILTDYIRKEYESSIGENNCRVEKIGVIPLFELLRRETDDQIRLGVLCGSLIIFPEEAADFIDKQIKNSTTDSGKISYQKICDSENKSLGYIKIKIKGKKHDAVKIATKVFEAGYIQVLIGTKSLLGEGWDSPCINALILASFVGSFVLSNQMRGRAIRMMKGQPEKTSNIWHLVCLQSDMASSIGRFMGSREEELSDDYSTLCRRMKSFLGVSYENYTIENGIERLGLPKDFYSPKEVQVINENMKQRAADRKALQRSWSNAIVIYDKMEAVDECDVPKTLLKPGVLFYNSIGWQIIYIALQVCNISFVTARIRYDDNGAAFFVSLLITLLFFILIFRYAARIVKLMTPLNRLQSIGNGLREALMRKNLIVSETKVVVEEADGSEFFVYLMGGTAREKDVFSNCLEQFLEVIDNQRYLLYAKSKWKSMQSFYRVPEVFAKSKQDAMYFQRILEKYIGSYRLVYTRNEAGRRLLLKGRKRAYANQVQNTEDQMCGRKKKIKGALY